MTLIQRYLQRQLTMPILAAVGSLAAIGLLSQSLDQLEIIVERGQSLWVMIKLTLLAMPQLISVILPIGVFVGALVALTRLQREQELTAAFAGGLTRWQALRPALRIAVAAVVVGLISNVWLQPWAQREARDTTFAIRTDLAALLVEEGRFVQGPDGITVYVQQIEQNGLLRNLFIYLQRGDNVTTWDAQEARFSRIDGAPVLTLVGGSMQRYASNGVLTFLSFDRYSFDLSPFVPEDQTVQYRASDLWLTQLFAPSPALIESAGPRPELAAEGHSRLASPLYALTAMALALSSILGGAFSRTGYGLRIAKAAGVFLVVRVVGYGLVAASVWSPWLNVLQYALPLAVAALAVRVLFLQLKPRPSRLRLRLRRATA
ncbi:LptF/LptG family permease [Brevundimonas balnearis]|uniref:LptF/LptG family permease n=1 Tax=Brevundimonas balnearis TaxID=1572858 RepID=A0ABV6R5D5_9CAUL